MNLLGYGLIGLGVVLLGMSLLSRNWKRRWGWQFIIGLILVAGGIYLLFYPPA